MSQTLIAKLLAFAAVVALVVVGCSNPFGADSDAGGGSGSGDANGDGGNPPAAPTEVNATATAGTTVEVTWSDASDNEDGFEIERIVEGGDWETDAERVEADADEESYTDEGLERETTYEYRLRAVNDDGASEWSEGASATTPDGDAPPAPSIEGLSSGTYPEAQSFTLSDIEEGASGEYSTDGGEEWSDYDGGEVAISDEGDYEVTARQTDDAGNTSASASLVDILIFFPPDGLEATTQSDGAISLEWSDNSDIEQAYVIERIEEGEDWSADTTRFETSAEQESYMDELLYPDTTYNYRVRAVNGMGQSEWSEDAEASTGSASAGDVQSVTPGSVDFNMHYVPPKSFPTETDDSGTSEVTAAYWIAETEVTYGVWDEVYQWATTGSGGADGEGEYEFANSGTQGSHGSQTDEHPVTAINWRDAMVWTNALTEYYNAQTGGSLEPVYYTDSEYDTPIRAVTDNDKISDDPGEEDNPYVNENADGFRLPTMDEWELAARFIEDTNGDGNIEDDGESYPGDYASGATADYNNDSATGEVAWYDDNSGSQTHPVAQKTANALGLSDISGNVWEWNFDWYPGYEGSDRVKRGGGWPYSADYLRVGNVNSSIPYSERGDNGFRPARNAE